MPHRVHYLSTADSDTFIRPFVRYVFLLAMPTPVLKTTTTDVRQMLLRGHQMTDCGL